MRNKAMWGCICLIVLAICCVSNVYSQNEAKVVAKVNGVGIKALSLDAAVNNFVANQKMFGVNVSDADKVNLRKDILEQLINAELLYQESQKLPLGDLGKEIDDQYESIKKGFKTEDEFLKVLKDRGATVDDLKNDIKKGISITKYLDGNVFNDLPAVSEDEKKQEYEKNKDKLSVPESVKASHILIKVSKDAKEQAKKKLKTKIEGLRKKAAAGEDFAKLAKENSEDTSAANGGDLGYFRRGEMVKPFEDAAFSLNNGQISNVIETEFGYHVLKVIDKKPARTLSYDEVKEDITNFLVSKKKREALDKVVEELKKTAKIEMIQ